MGELKKINYIPSYLLNPDCKIQFKSFTAGIKRHTQDKLKILFILHDFPSYRSAGAQLFALSLAKQINSLGKAEVEIIYPVFRETSMNDYSINESVYEGVKVYELHKPKVNEIGKIYDQKVFTAFDEF